MVNEEGALEEVSSISRLHPALQLKPRSMLELYQELEIKLGYVFQRSLLVDRP